MLSQRTGLVRTGLLLTGVLIAVQTYAVAQTHRKHVQKKVTAVVPSAPLALTVKTDQPVYPADSAVVFTLTAKNTTKENIILRFNSGQRYDFELFRGKDAKGEKVWQWARGRMFTMALSAVPLTPDKPLTFTETYRPGSDGNPTLTPGIYTLMATLKSAPKSSPMAPAVSAFPAASTTFKVN